MAVYMSVSTDPFEETFSKAQSGDTVYGEASVVRRPMRGVQKKRNTYALLHARRADGSPIMLFNSSAQAVNNVGQSEMYANFMVQSVQEARAEKQHIIETFGEGYAYFFGEQPRFLNVQGVIVNSSDFNWKSEFWTNYERFLRGTRLVEQNARLYFHFDDVVVEGYMTSASTVETSAEPHLMPLNFTIYVTHYAIVSRVGWVLLDQVDTNNSGGLPKAVSPVAPAAAGSQLAQQDNRGGFAGFVQKMEDAITTASFFEQKVLEQTRNFLYGRRVGFSEGIGDRTTIAPIQPAGGFPAPKRNLPFFANTDEYPEHGNFALSPEVKAASEAETARVSALLALQSPKALEAKARAEFSAMGYQMGGPSTARLLLGWGAWTALNFTASYGLAKVGFSGAPPDPRVLGGSMVL
jgi:hypothetical protein